MLRIVNPRYYRFLFLKIFRGGLYRDKYIASMLDSLSYSAAAEEFIFMSIRDKFNFPVYVFDINENSLVFEIGGFEGLWANEIIKRYNPHLHIFEPVASFCENLQDEFRNNTKVKIYNAGAWDEDCEATLYHQGMGSSLYSKKGISYDIQLFDIAGFISKNKIEKVDLININAEGAEYKILKRLIETGHIKKCKNIIVQFHEKYPNSNKSRALRNQLKEGLGKTHYCTFDFPFVYEGWKLKE